MSDSIFPHIKKSIEDFVSDQEGNIPRNKVLTIGSMMLILSVLLADDAFAKHRSHSSHRSHKSHRSGGHVSHFSHKSGTTHSNHSSHSNHSNHSSHSSHSNTHASHSNTHSSHSNAAPTLSALNAIKTPVNDTSLDVGAKLGLTAVNLTPPDTTAVVDTPPTIPSDTSE